jgi:hypothetical protein
MADEQSGEVPVCQDMAAGADAYAAGHDLHAHPMKFLVSGAQGVQAGAHNTQVNNYFISEGPAAKRAAGAAASATPGPPPVRTVGSTPAAVGLGKRLIVVAGAGVVAAAALLSYLLVTSTFQPPASTAASTPGQQHTPMSAHSINQVFKNYMDGLADHDMQQLRAATCPQLRYSLLGFLLNGYYVARWKMEPYTIPPDADELTVEADLTQQDPDTGRDAGDVANEWIVQRDSDGKYWVCGWLSYKGQ